jgi:hypothetical protein
MSNQQILQRLFADRLIQLQPASLLASPPPPLPAGLPFERVEGMMLGRTSSRLWFGP